MLSKAAEKTPLKRTVTQDEVGNATAFLCSNLASGITGEILYVDAGQNIMGAT
jgi:enoyl-[acyl-carrier protein] reductase I